MTLNIFLDGVMPICMPSGELLTMDWTGKELEMPGWAWNYDVNTGKVTDVKS